MRLADFVLAGDDYTMGLTGRKLVRVDVTYLIQPILAGSMLLSPSSDRC
jgi:hypothetical protein